MKVIRPELLADSGVVSRLAIDPRTHRFALSAPDQAVTMWGSSGKVEGTLAGPPSGKGHAPVKVGAFSPDGQLLATGSDDGVVRLWEVATGKERAQLPGHKGPIRAPAFSSDGRLLASGSEDCTARLWQLEGKR